MSEQKLNSPSSNTSLIDESGNQTPLPIYHNDRLDFGLDRDEISDMINTAYRRRSSKNCPARVRYVNRSFGYRKVSRCMSDKCHVCPLGRTRFINNHGPQFMPSKIFVKKNRKIKKCEYVYKPFVERRRKMLFNNISKPSKKSKKPKPNKPKPNKNKIKLLRERRKANANSLKTAVTKKNKNKKKMSKVK